VLAAEAGFTAEAGTPTGVRLDAVERPAGRGTELRLGASLFGIFDVPAVLK